MTVRGRLRFRLRHETAEGTAAGVYGLIVGSSVLLENQREEQALARVRQLHREAALAAPGAGAARGR